MFDWLLKRTPKKPSEGTGADMFADAYTRPGETADRWTVAARADMLVARLSGAFDIAINGNATDAAATKMRLYERTTKSNAKRVTGKRLDFLRGKLDHRPDAKTVSFVEDAGELVEITDGPVIDFLHQPNPWMTGAEWSFLRFKAREATGNAYSWFYGNGEIVEAYFLAPQCVRIVAEDGNPIALYRFSRNMTDWLEMQPEQVFHTKLRPSLQDFRLGDTWVHGILKHLDAQEAALDSELARQRNMQRPDYAAVVKGNSTPDQRNEIRKVLRNDFRGPAQAGKAAGLGGDIEIIPLGWAPKDLENQELFRYIDQIIDRAAGRPESLSKLNDASRANAGTGLIQYMRNTIQPRQSKDAVELTDFLLPIFGLEPGRYFFAYDNCVPEDEAAKTTLRIQKAAAGLITWDEARAEDGMEPYAKGLGDVPRVNGVPAQTQQQLDEQRQAQADALYQSAMGRVGGDKPEDKEEPKDAEDEVAKASKTLAVALLTPKAHTGKGVSLIRGKDFRLPRELERQLDGLSYDVQNWLRGIAARAPMREDGTVDLSEFKVSMRRALDSRLYEVLQQGGVDALSQAGSSRTLASNNEALREYFDTYTFQTAEAITETTRTQIEGAISRMVQEGVSLNDSIRAIREALPDTSRARADMIARSESARAYGVGNMAGWTKAGMGWKEWLLSSDPCPQCTDLVTDLSASSALDSSLPERLRGRPVVSIDEPFTTTDYGPVYTQPLHPSCRCGTAAVNDITEMTEDEAEAEVNRMMNEMRQNFGRVSASIN